MGIDPFNDGSYFENGGEYTDKQIEKAGEKFNEEWKKPEGTDVSGWKDVIEDIPMKTVDKNSLENQIKSKNKVINESLESQLQMEYYHTSDYKSSYGPDIDVNYKNRQSIAKDREPEYQNYFNNKINELDKFEEYEKNKNKYITDLRSENTKKMSGSGFEDQYRNYDLNLTISEKKRLIDLKIRGQLQDEYNIVQEQFGQAPAVEINDKNRESIIEARGENFKDTIAMDLNELKVLEAMKIKQEMKDMDKDKEIQYAVRGAIMRCNYGSHIRRLNLPQCHGVYLRDRPMVNHKDVDVGDNMNIPTFGVCGNPNNTVQGIIRLKKVEYSRNSLDKIVEIETGELITGRACFPEIITYWLCYDEKTMVDDGYAVTVDSFAVCKYGAIIDIVDSGQMDEATAISENDRRIQEGSYIQNSI